MNNCSYYATILYNDSKIVKRFQSKIIFSVFSYNLDSV